MFCTGMQTTHRSVRDLAYRFDVHRIHLLCRSISGRGGIKCVSLCIAALPS